MKTFLVVSKKNTIRESNFELLRIVCMLFVVMQHFWGHALYPELQSSNDTTSPAASFITLGFLYIAVNCFVLISGFFRIRTTVHRFIRFTFLVVFYNFLSLAYVRIAGGGTIDLLLIFKTFKHCYNNWWFVSCYVYLMLLAPIINKAIEHFSQRQCLHSIMFVGIADLFLGYLMKMDNGYSVIHFIFLYVLGAYISKYSSLLDKLTRLQSLSIYIACALLWGIIAYATSGKNVYLMTNISYNNPLIVIGALSFFVLFRNIHFKSKIINKIASFAIASYLLQDGIGSWLYPWFGEMFYIDNILMNIATMIVCSIVWFAGCSLIDIARQYMWKAIEKTANRFQPIHCFNQRKK